MKKRLFCIAMICILLLAAAACGKKAEVPAATEEQVSANVSAVTENIAAMEETKTVPIPTIGGDFEIPEGEAVEDWEETAEPEDESDSEVNNETQEPTEGKAETGTKETTPAEAPAEKEGCGCEYAKYLALPPEQQQQYMENFDSPMVFIEWSKAAEAEHATHVTVIEASGEVLDIGDYIK